MGSTILRIWRMACVATTLATIFAMARADSAQAGPKTAAAKEAAEYIAQKFGLEAAESSVETLASRMESLAVKYGDDALAAARRAGPRGVQAVEQAGEHAPLAIRLLQREGDDALWVAGHSDRLALVAKHGDEAATAMLKHKAVADPLIAALDAPAAKALAAVDGQNARRLAMMAESGELAKIGHTPQLLDTVARYGDRGMDFIWKHKGPLAGATVLTAFLADPQPFIDGTKDLTEIVATGVVRPVGEAVASEAARRTNWTLLGVTAVLAVCAYLGWRTFLKRHAWKAVQQN